MSASVCKKLSSQHKINWHVRQVSSKHIYNSDYMCSEMCLAIEILSLCPVASNEITDEMVLATHATEKDMWDVPVKLCHWGICGQRFQISLRSREEFISAVSSASQLALYTYALTFENIF